jgi:hypothetical protein
LLPQQLILILAVMPYIFPSKHKFNACSSFFQTPHGGRNVKNARDASAASSSAFSDWHRSSVPSPKFCHTISVNHPAINKIAFGSAAPFRPSLSPEGARQASSASPLPELPSGRPAAATPLPSSRAGQIFQDRKPFQNLESGPVLQTTTRRTASAAKAFLIMTGEPDASLLFLP